jgi:hypothetical protein
MSWWKKSPKLKPNPILGKIKAKLFLCKKVAQNYLLLFKLKKTVPRQQSPDRRKFAQTGHPVEKTNSKVCRFHCAKEKSMPATTIVADLPT